MNLFDDENLDNKKPVGGWAKLGALKDKVSHVGGDNTDSAWGRIWSKRGGFPFSLKRGERATVVFLDDVRLFIAAPLMTGWVSDGKSFPKIDYVASPGFDEDGNAVGECILSKVTGFSPTLIGVVPILDTRSFKTKDGKERAYTIKPLIIKSESVLNQLQTISQHHGRPLTWARMTVSRNMDDKSPASGDAYYCDKFTNPEELLKKIPSLLEERAAIDVVAGYPRPDHATCMQLLKLHVAVADKNSNRGSKVTNYNKELWAQLCGSPASPSRSQALDELEDIPSNQDTTRGEVSTTGAADEFDLSELDEALG